MRTLLAVDDASDLTQRERGSRHAARGQLERDALEGLRVLDALGANLPVAATHERLGVLGAPRQDVIHDAAGLARADRGGALKMLEQPLDILVIGLHDPQLRRSWRQTARYFARFRAE